MEDKHVKPGLYAYQFRVDVENITEYTTIFEFIKKYDVKHYIIGAEVSKSGKPHFQCILWFASKINATKLRNWWKGRTATTTQPVSLTSAKKIKALGKYCSKDKNYVTNLTKEEMELIGKWDNKLQNAEWSKMLDEHAKKFDPSDVNKYDTYGNDTYKEHVYNDQAVMYAFLYYMLDYYKTNNKRPSRATLQYLAWKHGHLTNHLLIHKWF